MPELGTEGLLRLHSDLRKNQRIRLELKNSRSAKEKMRSAWLRVPAPIASLD
jgi:hypothetical protein